VPDSTHDNYAGMRILVAEDNRSNQIVAEAMLQYIGCSTDVVSNGREAVDMVMKNSYDIVFMDCFMPVMDGFEATSEILRLQSGQKRTFIVALTANAIKGYREKCLAAGMDDYLSKPIRTDEVQKVLERFKSLRQNRLVPCGRPDTPHEQDACSETVFDPDRLKELLNLFRKTGKDILPAVVEPFLKNIEESIPVLHESIEHGDYPGIRSTAHLLRGGSRNLGLKNISSICAALLDNERIGSHRDALELVNSLKDELLVTRNQIASMREKGHI
jgi:CheY-like chemotaxis protein/HPt (histidine-containing phosphotransfer) domain-containing protein